MKPLWRSLRAQTAIGIFGVALVPTLLLTWVNYRATSESLRNSAEATARATAERAAAEVDRFHTRSDDYLRTLYRLEALGRFLVSSPAEQRAQRRAVQHLLLSLRTLDEVYVRAVGLADPTGRLVLDDGGNSTTDRWMLDELDEARGRAFPAQSRVTGVGNGYFVETAVQMEAAGRLAGFLVLRFDAAVLQSILERHRSVGEGMFELWIDDELHIRLAGETPASPLLTTKRPLKPALRDSLVAARLLRTDASAVPMTPRVLYAHQRADSTAVFGVEERYGDDSTRTFIGASAPMHERPWRVSAVRSAREALAPARAVTLKATGLAIALASLAFVLALFGSQRLISPLSALAQQAHRIAAGDFSARVTVAASSEMSELGEAFNHLAERVGTLVSALAERSRELELELQERARLEHELTDARHLESVGRLAGGVAHDFNNLLTVVLANLSLLEDSLPPDSPVLDELRAAHEAALRGADLTRQLLAYSRRGTVAARTIDLAASVRKLEPLVVRLVGDTVRLVVETEPGVLAVVMDPSQLDQVVMNLAANARDAMPTGGTLRVGVKAVSTTSAILGLPPGRYIELSVQDSGVGMSADTVARAFEPFFTTKAVGRGTGLGLATVYGIVTRSGGSVHIESLPGRGTIFVVRLPVATELPAGEDVSEAPARTPVGHHELLVLAEDDPLVRSATARQLRNLGYEVIEAEDGEAARDAVARLAPNVRLVVSDVLMPRLDGVALRRILHGEYPNLPVLLLSGNPPDEISSLRWSGEFLAKPYSVADLATRVRDLIDHPPASD